MFDHSRNVLPIKLNLLEKSSQADVLSSALKHRPHGIATVRAAPREIVTVTDKRK